MGSPEWMAAPENGIMGVKNFKITLTVNLVSLKTHKSAVTRLHTALLKVTLFGAPGGMETPEKGIEGVEKCKYNITIGLNGHQNP